MFCSDFLQGPTQDLLRLNVFEQVAGTSKGHERSRTVLNPQQFKASWIVLMVFPSFSLQSICHLLPSPQFKADGGIICVKASVAMMVS